MLLIVRTNSESTVPLPMEFVQHGRQVSGNADILIDEFISAAVCVIHTSYLASGCQHQRKFDQCIGQPDHKGLFIAFNGQSHIST